MPIMVSRKSHTYAMKVWNAGDEFEARKEDVGVLTSLGRANLKDAPSTKVGATTLRSKQPAPEVQPPQEGGDSQTQTAEEQKTTPVEPPVATTESGAVPPTRYRTRRLKADGE